MKKLIFLLLVILLALQWRWWFGDGGIHDVRRYRAEVESLAASLEQQTDINRALAAEVRDLKEGLGEIEARARAELGMIRGDETFYQFVGDDPAGPDLAAPDNTIAPQQPGRDVPQADQSSE